MTSRWSRNNLKSSDCSIDWGRWPVNRSGNSFKKWLKDWASDYVISNAMVNVGNLTPFHRSLREKFKVQCLLSAKRQKFKVQCLLSAKRQKFKVQCSLSAKRQKFKVQCLLSAKRQKFKVQCSLFCQKAEIQSSVIHCSARMQKFNVQWFNVLQKAGISKFSDLMIQSSKFHRSASGHKFQSIIERKFNVNMSYSLPSCNRVYKSVNW